MTQRNPDMDLLHYKLMRLSAAMHGVGNVIDRENPPTVGLREAYELLEQRYKSVIDLLDRIIPGGCPDAGR